MLISIWIEFKTHKSASQCDSGSARGKRPSKRIQDQVCWVGGIFNELFNERFGQLIIVAYLACFVFSGQALYTQPIIVGIRGIGETAMGVECPFLPTFFLFGPEQHMIVAGDPFPLGVHPNRILGNEMIDLLHASLV